MRKVYVARRNPANLALDRPRALIPHSTVHESRLYCLATGLVSGIARALFAPRGVADYSLKNVLDYRKGRCYIDRILAPEGCLLEPPS